MKKTDINKTACGKMDFMPTHVTVNKIAQDIRNGGVTGDNEPVQSCMQGINVLLKGGYKNELTLVQRKTEYASVTTSLMLQECDNFARQGRKVIFISARRQEELIRKSLSRMSYDMYLETGNTAYKVLNKVFMASCSFDYVITNEKQYEKYCDVLVRYNEYCDNILFFDCNLECNNIANVIEMTMINNDIAEPPIVIVDSILDMSMVAELKKICEDYNTPVLAVSEGYDIVDANRVNTSCNNVLIISPFPDDSENKKNRVRVYERERRAKCMRIENKVGEHVNVGYIGDYAVFEEILDENVTKEKICALAS